MCLLIICRWLVIRQTMSCTAPRVAVIPDLRPACPRSSNYYLEVLASIWYLCIIFRCKTHGDFLSLIVLNYLNQHPMSLLGAWNSRTYGDMESMVHVCIMSNDIFTILHNSTEYFTLPSLWIIVKFYCHPKSNGKKGHFFPWLFGPQYHTPRAYHRS